MLTTANTLPKKKAHPINGIEVLKPKKEITNKTTASTINFKIIIHVFL